MDAPIKSEFNVKIEHPSPTMADAAEDDVYEDAGDLELLNRNEHGQSNDNDRMFFVKLPKNLWEAWSHLDDDAPIQIGTIRRWDEVSTETVGFGKNKRMEQVSRSKFKMLINNRPEHKELPKEYNLEVTRALMTNTFLFTEQDLESHRVKNRIKSEQQNIGIPHSVIKNSWASQHDRKPDVSNNQPQNMRQKGRRWTPYPSKQLVVPKKTELYGRFIHEANCAPVDNEESRKALRDRVRLATEPKRPMELMGLRDSTGRGFINNSTDDAFDQFSTFIKTADIPLTKQKKQETKAIRVGTGELRDMLSMCFKKFTYWSMKALRQETQQPEAYLRENLEEMAILHKSGPFSNHWELRPEFKAEPNDQGTNEMAPISMGDLDVSEAE